MLKKKSSNIVNIKELVNKKMTRLRNGCESG